MNERLKRANETKEKALANKKRYGYKGKEKDLQSLCEQYLNILDIRFVHIPDQLWTFIITKAPPWIAKVCSRYLKGVPDLLIFYRDKCLVVELKNRTGRSTQGQIDWQKNVDVKLVRDFEIFKGLVDEFIK